MMNGKDKAYWFADKITAYGDYAKEAAQVLRKQADEIELIKPDAELCKQILNGLIERGGIPNWILDLTPNAKVRGGSDSDRLVMPDFNYRRAE